MTTAQDKPHAKMPGGFIQHDASDMPREVFMWVNPEDVRVDDEHRVWILCDAKVYHSRTDLFGEPRAAIVRRADGAIHMTYNGRHRWQPGSRNLSPLYLIPVASFRAVRDEDDQ